VLLVLLALPLLLPPLSLPLLAPLALPLALLAVGLADLLFLCAALPPLPALAPLPLLPAAAAVFLVWPPLALLLLLVFLVRFRQLAALAAADCDVAGVPNLLEPSGRLRVLYLVRVCFSCCCPVRVLDGLLTRLLAFDP
jgi:hypothetical protein